jgi:hypothetical protein
MDNVSLGKAMLITYAQMGVKIDRLEDTDDGIIFLFTVPKTSWEFDAKGKEMSGKHLASRVKHTLEDMGMVFVDIRYGIRNEHWDKAKGDAAKNEMLKDMGYKKWQINRKE